MKYKFLVIWYYIEIGWAKFINLLGFERDASVIPEGLYCYKFNGKTGIDDRGFTWYGTDVCKYYRSMKNQCDAACTYCGFIGFDPCLGDQCKICGENDEK